VSDDRRKCPALVERWISRHPVLTAAVFDVAARAEPFAQVLERPVDSVMVGAHPLHGDHVRDLVNVERRKMADGNDPPSENTGLMARVTVIGLRTFEVQAMNCKNRGACADKLRRTDRT